MIDEGDSWIDSLEAWRMVRLYGREAYDGD